MRAASPAFLACLLLSGNTLSGSRTLNAGLDSSGDALIDSFGVANIVLLLASTAILRLSCAF
jgi:hypothetical protein